MQEDAVIPFVGLFAAHDKLAILDRNRQIVLAEPGHGQRDPESVVAKLFDIVGRIAVVGFRGPLHQPFQLIEAKKEGVCPQGQFAHVSSSVQATNFRVPSGNPLGENMGTPEPLRKCERPL